MQSLHHTRSLKFSNYGRCFFIMWCDRHVVVLHSAHEIAGRNTPLENIHSRIWHSFSRLCDRIKSKGQCGFTTRNILFRLWLGNLQSHDSHTTLPQPMTLGHKPVKADAFCCNCIRIGDRSSNNIECRCSSFYYSSILV